MITWRRVAAIVVAGGVAGCGGGGGHELTYRVPSGSMQPTLKLGSYIQVDLGAYATKAPAIGDIVVLHPPQRADAEYCSSPGEGTGHPSACDSAGVEDESQMFIKRVVGLPGDHLQFRGTDVLRNGRRESPSFAGTCPPTDCNFPRTIVVPAGEYYVLGDNRGDSDDSRMFGPIPRAWFVGRRVLS